MVSRRLTAGGKDRNRSRRQNVESETKKSLFIFIFEAIDFIVDRYLTSYNKEMIIEISFDIKFDEHMHNTYIMNALKYPRIFSTIAWFDAIAISLH